MAQRLIPFLLSLLMLSCSRLEWDDGKLPPLPADAASMNSQLPRIDIHAAQDSLYYMFRRFNDDIEISARMDFYDRSGQLRIEKREAKLEIKGTSSARYVCKSLGLIFTEALDNSKRLIIDPPRSLPGHNLDELYSLRLRNSGNDFGRSMIKDLCYTDLAIEAGLHFDLMYGTPVQVFINGSYYGLLNLRTENNPYGLAGLFGAEAEDFTLFRMDDGDLEFDEGDSVRGVAMEHLFKEGSYRELREVIDRQSLIDYIIFQDYIGNDDWPEANCRAHMREGEPLRFFLFDLDYAAFRTRNPRLPELEYLDDDLSRLYRVFNEGDPDFKTDLDARQAELYRLFAPSIFNQLADSRTAEIESEIGYLISKYQQPASLLHWQMELAELKREFERQDHFIRKKYGL